MKKFILLLLLALTGCAHMVDNPFGSMSQHQLSGTSSQQLCASVGNGDYKPSVTVLKELVRRGYKDCSASELFCRENLGLKPGTQSFVNCRIQRDQYELNVARAKQQAHYENMSLWQASRPQEVYVHNSYNPFSSPFSLRYW